MTAEKARAAMTAEQSRAAVLEHFKRLNDYDLEGAAEFYAPGFRFHGLTSQILDAAGWKHALGTFLVAFPDAHFSVDDVVVEGNKVVVRHTFRGTHQQMFQGVPPTGRQVALSGMVLYHTADDKLIEGWLNADFLGLLQQLGVIQPST